MAMNARNPDRLHIQSMLHRLRFCLHKGPRANPVRRCIENGGVSPPLAPSPRTVRAVLGPLWLTSGMDAALRLVFHSSSLFPGMNTQVDIVSAIQDGC